MRSTRSGMSGDKKSAAEDNSKDSDPGSTGRETGTEVSRLDNKLDFIISELHSIKNDIASMRNEQSEIIKSLEHCVAQVNDNSNKITTNETNIRACINDISDVSKNMESLKREFTVSNSELVVLQQYTRKNCVDVMGVPFEKGENILDIIKKIADHVGFYFRADMVDNCHRIYIKNPNVSPPIIVKFNRFIDKELFLQCKTSKGSFVANDVGWTSSNQVIYINESMSPLNRIMFQKSKALQKRNLLKYVWFRHGNVRVKVDDSSDTKIIKSLSDVEAILA